ncbi:MAG TPA: MFS transporter [Candidatus Binataceae bacterium]|nr:MFS transporter [Candidatus Binataceae bacterium]
MSEIISEIAAAASPTAEGAALSEESSSRTVRAVFAVLSYQGYAFSLLGVAAPFVAKGFGLDQTGIARMYAWISLNAFGALLLSRLADRMGRRRVLLFALLLTPLCSLGAALSTINAWFIAFEIVAYAAIGASFTSAIVMLAEALPIDQRSRGQGLANLAIGTGGGLCVILAPVLSHFGWSWRWLFALPTIGIALVPAMIRMVPESGRWEAASAAGVTERSHFYDIFSTAYRGRAIPLLIATLLGEVAGAAVPTWVYYHAVSIVKLSPWQGSVILLVGGTISVAGLVLGVWMAERVGRVRTIVILGLAGVVGVLAFYWGPPTNCAWPTLWLLLAHTWFATTGRGLTVAANSAVTELFPTALRGTIMGWLLFCITLSAISAQVTISILARPLGGLSNVVGWLALLTIPSVLIWGWFMDETRGLSLEVAAKEAAAVVA